MTERALVNFFYAHPVGHAIEALHYCQGHYAANPDRQIAVALNAATPVELASYCPAVSAAYAIDHPFVEPCPDEGGRFDGVPGEWDWILDDFRRYQDIQLSTFPGLRDYYAASDRRLTARSGRSVVSDPAAGYLRHQQLRLALPESARAAATARLGDRPDRIVVMPAGSSPSPLYPSPRSWTLILDAIHEEFPDAQIVLLGKLARSERTTTSFGEAELAALLSHRSRPVNCFDLPLAEQLAAVEAAGVFLSPHTGFGLAALAVGTPWLTLSGGRWFEYFFNHVPFRSILPDPGRYPSFTQFDDAEIIVDGEDGRRTPSMTLARITEDLDRIVLACRELLDGSLTYDQALRDYFPALVAAHGGDASAIWSIDGVHFDYL
ncbi:hypothetical protein [Amycolatopsis sp. CA-230715]|uniref:hypothetical protein n=1 Tax=Amycolatopsis sp. CA-230715 TaxID=2745196 RepID=UPI001C0260EE|nr:hypothetical protein [Amycolatopsis sp. CA-230715]QWF78638.1 hypothetical protein HUW46_02036 [Amycolatopsis sp. CA-230715]